MAEYNLTDNLTLSIAPAHGFTLVELREWDDDICDWQTVYSRRHACGTYFEYALDALCATFPDVWSEVHECTLNDAGLATEWADDDPDSDSDIVSVAAKMLENSFVPLIFR